jgi:hypothetical protein
MLQGANSQVRANGCEEEESEEEESGDKHLSDSGCVSLIRLCRQSRRLSNRNDKRPPRR